MINGLWDAMSSLLAVLVCNFCIYRASAYVTSFGLQVRIAKMNAIFPGPKCARGEGDLSVVMARSGASFFLVLLRPLPKIHLGWVNNSVTLASDTVPYPVSLIRGPGKNKQRQFQRSGCKKMRMCFYTRVLVHE